MKFNAVNYIFSLLLVLFTRHYGIIHGFEIQNFGSFMKSFIGLNKIETMNDQLKFKYKNYFQHLELLQELELKCSNIMKIHKYESNKELYCGESKCQYFQIRLGLSNDDDDANHEIPKILIISGIHGDEKLSVEIATEFINSICDQYINQNNIGIKYLLTTRNIWIVPIANPWGFYHNKRNEEEIDVNRDFPSKSGENCLQSESSKMIYNLFNLNSFVFVATLHGGLKSISYGNGYFELNHHHHHHQEYYDQNNKIFEFIAKDLQASAGKILQNNKLNYFYQNIGQISKAVYPVKGGFEDWSFFGYNSNYLTCSNYIQKSHQANHGGSLTFLIETDLQKNPNQQTLGSKSDTFSPIDLDKLIIQPSHITRNIRMLLKLVEYTYPDIIFFNSPPENIYYGQTFPLYIAIIGCYSFTNLKFKLENSNQSSTKQQIYLNFLVNEGIDGLQNTIYYKKCSSLFLNKQEIQDLFNNDSIYSSKDQCNDSNLLTKIVNRSFRFKNKCKSIYQFNKFKPIKFLIHIPNETIILNSFNGEIQNFLFKAELEFDNEIIQTIPSINRNFFQKFIQLRSLQNKNQIERPIIHLIQPFKETYSNQTIQDFDSNTRNHNLLLSGFQIKITKPQEILQIEFTNCFWDLLINSNNKWTKSCNAFHEFNQEILNFEKNSNNHLKSFSNIIHDKKMVQDNIKYIFENSQKELQGNLYIIPSDPRTSIIYKNLTNINNNYNNLKTIPSLLENDNHISTTLPYFNNITLEISVTISNEPKNNGEYVILKFPEFLNLLNINISKYNNIENILMNYNKELNFIGIISINDFYGDENEQVPFQIIKSISRQRIYEMVTEIQNKEDFYVNDQENHFKLLEKYYIILRYYKNDLKSIALGKIYIDNYLMNSLGANIQEFQNLNNNNLNSNNNELNNNIKKSEYLITLKEIRSWWYNNSKDYMDFRLVLVLCGLLMIILTIILILIKTLRYFNWGVPLNSLRFEFKKRFRTNSKMFIIDISSEEDSDRIEDKGKKKKRRIKSRKVYDSQELSYTPRSDYISNKNYTLSQRFNTNNSDFTEKVRDSPYNSPSSKEFKTLNLNPSQSSLSSFDNFKSRSNTMKELEVIEMERHLDIGMLNNNSK